MKYAFIFVAVCAFASAFGLPVSDQKSRAVVTRISKSASEKIDELLETEKDLLRKIHGAKTDSQLESLMKELESVDKELQALLKEEQGPTNGLLDGPSENEESSSKEWLRERIAEIRSAIVSLTKELASIVWQQARAHGETLQEQLAIAKEKVVRNLTEMKEELLRRIREAMIPDDDVPVTYVIDEVFEQIIAGLRAQISDALAVLSDWHNLLTESGRAKIAAAKEKIDELTKKIADIIHEWKNSKESKGSSTTESSNYMAEPFYNDKFMMMLKKFLEDLKDQLELKKLEVTGSVAETEQEILAHLEEVSAQVKTSIDSINKMIKEVTGIDVSFMDPIERLKNLLALKLQELQDSIRNAADKQQIEILEQEIIHLRRNILEALRDMFQRP